MKIMPVLLVFMMLLFGCDNYKYKVIPVKIGQSNFDGEVITFYDEQVYRNGHLTSNWMCYQVGSEKSKNDGILLSEDGCLKMYVDFNGQQEVFDASGNLIELVDRIAYENHDINIYVLDTEKTYYELTKGLDEYSFCSTDEKGSTVSCEMNIEILETEVGRWIPLGDTQDFVPAESFDVFFEISKNQREVGELVRHWTFAKNELDDGRWVVFIMEYERVYYLLDVHQVESFKKLINH